MVTASYLLKDKTISMSSHIYVLNSSQCRNSKLKKRVTTESFLIPLNRKSEFRDALPSASSLTQTTI